MPKSMPADTVSQSCSSSSPLYLLLLYGVLMVRSLRSLDWRTTTLLALVCICSLCSDENFGQGGVEGDTILPIFCLYIA